MNLMTPAELSTEHSRIGVDFLDILHEIQSNKQNLTGTDTPSEANVAPDVPILWDQWAQEVIPLLEDLLASKLETANKKLREQEETIRDYELLLKNLTIKIEQQQAEIARLQKALKEQQINQLTQQLHQDTRLPQNPAELQSAITAILGKPPETSPDHSDPILQTLEVIKKYIEANYNQEWENMYTIFVSGYTRLLSNKIANNMTDEQFIVECSRTVWRIQSFIKTLWDE